MTKGERILVGKGRGENVLALRREYQEAMREESSAKVAQLTGRNVIAMMSANHIDPDLAAEIYVLDGPPGYNHVPPTTPSDDSPPMPDSPADQVHEPKGATPTVQPPGPAVNSIGILRSRAVLAADPGS